MTAFLYRMPAGIPGDVSRKLESTVSQEQMDGSAPVTAYGLPVKLVSGKIQAIGSGDAATAIKGWLVRPYPTQQQTQPALGTAVPATTGICDILRRGYMTVTLSSGSVAAAKGGIVYIRVAAAAGGKPIGGIEAAADSTNTIVVPNCFFTGPADAAGNTEIEYNL